MTKTITFTKGDLTREFISAGGCPIYTTLVRAGVPVLWVGDDNWRNSSGENHKFSRRLNQASNFLADTDYPSAAKKLRLRKKLVGKSYRITY